MPLLVVSIRFLAARSVFIFAVYLKYVHLTRGRTGGRSRLFLLLSPAVLTAIFIARRVLACFLGSLMKNTGNIAVHTGCKFQKKGRGGGRRGSCGKGCVRKGDATVVRAEDGGPLTAIKFDLESIALWSSRRAVKVCRCSEFTLRRNRRLHKHNSQQHSNFLRVTWRPG